MSEQIDELEVLRRTNAELVRKSSDRKARIAELEAANATLQTDLATAQTAFHEMTVSAPMKQMAEAVSAVPEIWLAEFSKHFKVEFKDGQLIVLTAAGEPAVDKKGEPVPFTQDAIVSLVTKSDKPEFKAFDVITIGSRASGGGAGGSHAVGAYVPTDDKPAAPAKQPTHFGLR